MAGECIVALTDDDLRVLARVFDCQPDALPLIVHEACAASVMRAAMADEWDGDRLPTYDEYPFVDLDRKRLIFIPNDPARDVMDWLAGAADDFVEGRTTGGKKMGMMAERLAQAIGAQLGFEIEPPEAAVPPPPPVEEPAPARRRARRAG
jgi:hypothetical protein